MSFHIINKFLGNDVQGDTLARVVTQTLLNSCLGFLHQPCIDPLSLEICDQKLEGDVVPVWNDKRLVKKVLLFYGKE